MHLISIGCRTNKSVKKFIINEGILGDISLDHVVGEVLDEEATDDHGDENGHEDVASGHIEDVHEVDGVHQEDEFVARHQHVSECIPVILEEYREFADKLHIKGATD